MAQRRSARQSAAGRSARLAGAQRLPKERVQFQRLVAANPNHFGNLTDSPFKVVKKMILNTTYEEVTCVGYNPDKGLLEATIEIKQATGYSGDLCVGGSTEYVRFFVDDGSGWQDAGLAGVKVHDIPSGQDCAGALDKPLSYIATLKYEHRPRRPSAPASSRCRA